MIQFAKRPSGQAADPDLEGIDTRRQAPVRRVGAEYPAGESCGSISRNEMRCLTMSKRSSGDKPDFRRLDPCRFMGGINWV